MNDSLKWVIVDSWIISLGVAGHIPNDRWQSFMDAIKSVPITHYLAMAIGSVEPNSLQRKEVFEFTKIKGIRVAVITDEKMVRGVVTAASWFGVDVKSFSWGQLPEAMRHFGATKSFEERALKAVTKLKSSH
jgi:hypothetical protein